MTAQPITRAEIERVTDGIFGLITCLMSATGRLTAEEVATFCRNTPGNKVGAELWREFTSRRDAQGAKEGYGFIDFMREVIAEVASK